MSASTTSPAVDRTTRPIIELNGLRVEFPRLDGSSVFAVNGIDLAVGEGETLGIVGESGCGKSTVARSLMGLVPTPGRIAGGTVRVAGVDIGTATSRELRRMRGAKAAMVFQDPLSALNPVMTIGAQIEEALATHLGLNRRERRDRAVQLLADVGISDPAARAKAYPHQLSGGMRQRAVIAIAISCSPQVLIADEPTTALDVTVQAQILELLDRLRQSLGMTIVLVSHDLGVVAGTADRVAVMYAGTIVEQGSVFEVLGNPVHPYTRALLASRMEIDAERRDRLQAIAGSAPSLGAAPTHCPFAPRCVDVRDECRSGLPRLVELDSPSHRAACFVRAPERARKEVKL